MRRLGCLLLALLSSVVVYITVTDLVSVPEDIVYVQYIVQPGDTAWDLVARNNDQYDPRKLLDQWKEMNGSTQIFPGQTVLVPVVVTAEEMATEKAAEAAEIESYEMHNQVKKE